MTISNLRYGLVCGPANARRVCFQTGEIQVTEEGRCVFDGQPKVCTWFGYEFDYEVNISNVALQCTFSEDVPATFGNPKEQLESGAKRASYTIELFAGRHHYFNPQYTTANPAGLDDTIIESCSYAGNNVFTVTFHTHEAEPAVAP